MNHVFVETNFLIDVARPFPSPDATDLLEALEIHTTGERSLWFCNLNTKDFDPANQPGLTDEYAASGLTYLSSFAVPT